MGKDPYVSPEGFTPVVMEVFPYKGDGLACLVVQSNEDRDLHFSEINLCSDFANEDPETVFSIKSWIYSMLQDSGEKILICHSGKTLRFGAHADPQILMTVDVDMTRLLPANDGAFVLGLNGYVGLLRGSVLTDMSIPGETNLYYVSQAADGTIMASAGSGGFYRYQSGTWNRIDLQTNVEIYRVEALAHNQAILAGSNGFCARWTEDGLEVYKAAPDRDYRDLTFFQGRLFLGAGYKGLDVLDGDEVVPFKETAFSYHLNSSAKYLFAAGYNLVARFDGKAWLATEFT